MPAEKYSWLITGGAGFIGLRLTKALTARRQHVRGNFFVGELRHGKQKPQVRPAGIFRKTKDRKVNPALTAIFSQNGFFLIAQSLCPHITNLHIFMRGF